jgi:aryl-alcohol dehydrogenase-like predicted oxidoreductase
MHTTLTTRRLGVTDMEITTVGFGAWAIGGGGWAFGWGPQDDGQSISTIRHAVERGINWIDTAAVYGLGHSEEVVRHALEDMPAEARPYIFTKCGMIWDENDRMAAPRQVLRPESIRRECEASLRRLGVERIDLYQFHWPDETGTAVEDSWAEMARLVDEGKVRAAGVSNFDVRLLERCEAIRQVDSLQPPFSMIRRRAAEAEIPWCAAHHTGVIVYSPMQSGLLTDNFSQGGCEISRRTTGAAAHPSSSRRGSAAISRCATACGPSPSGRAPASPASPSPGRWRGPVSPARSSAGARPGRWTAGSTPAHSSSLAKTWTRSPR